MPNNKFLALIPFYKVVMPTITIVLLLGVASLIARPVLVGSRIFDAFVRVFLCLWFCIGSALVHKSRNKRNPSVVATVQATMEQSGIPKWVIRLRAAHRIRACVTCVSSRRADKRSPKMVLRRDIVVSAKERI